MEDLGQLIMTGISGLSLTDEESKFIEEKNIGGVLLFSKNYDSPAQLAELVNSIQKLRREYPLYIAVDQEGGRVIRFKEPFTQFPSMLDVASLGSPKLCYNVANIMANELSACGVNVNFSPVCDIFNNPSNKVIGDRAFGKTEEEVSKYISSIIRGLQTNKVLSCAKHFPGHGCTTKDSHYDLPIVKKSIEELRENEFQPFVKAIKSRVEFVMMAHLIVDAIDEELPTSLSSKAHDILRNELRFKKVIVTDDMQMQAITDNYGVKDAAVKAVDAGANLVEYRDMEFAKEAYEGLLEAYQDKKLKADLISQRISVVKESKKQNLASYEPVYIPEISKHVGTKSSEIFLNEISEKIEELKNQE